MSELPAAVGYGSPRRARGPRGHHVKARIVDGSQTLPCDTRLGQRLRDLRVAAGLTQTDMAAVFGYKGAGGRVSDWELGHRLPTLTTLIKYAERFEMTLSQLLDGI